LLLFFKGQASFSGATTYTQTLFDIAHNGHLIYLSLSRAQLTDHERKEKSAEWSDILNKILAMKPYEVYKKFLKP